MGSKIMGSRIIKTAVAVVVSIYLSYAIGLHSPNSAGLLAILGVDVTKKKGLQTSFQRIAASITGLFVGVLLFWLFGFRIWVVGLYVLVLFPILHRLKLKEGVVTSSVVMFHVFNAGEINTALLVNEVALLIVGLGTATLINVIYMPKIDDQLWEYRISLEDLYSRIFSEISHHLRDNQYVWSGSELLEAEDVLNKGLQAAKRASDNSLFSGSAAWSVYFYMRDQQMASIKRMVLLVARVYQTLPHGELLANVFDGVKEDVRVDYYTGRTEKQLAHLELQFKQMPLPATREEFEVRAALLQLLEELKAFLSISKREQRAQG